MENFNENILDYRLVVLDFDGQIYKYPRIFGDGHQEALADFCKKKGYDLTSYCETLVPYGNVFFVNHGLNWLSVYLPNELSEGQLYQMDYIHNWLGKVELLETRKYLGNNINNYEDYICPDDIKPIDYFSNTIIQSYYSGKSRT